MFFDAAGTPTFFLLIGRARAGWSDLRTDPPSSAPYGIGVCLVSVLVVWTLFRFGLDHALFPAIAGFLVVGPLLSVGLFEMSRLLETGERGSGSAE